MLPYGHGAVTVRCPAATSSGVRTQPGRPSGLRPTGAAGRPREARSTEMMEFLHAGIDRGRYRELLADHPVFGDQPPDPFVTQCPRCGDT